MMVTHYRYCVLTLQVCSETEALDTINTSFCIKNRFEFGFAILHQGEIGSMDAAHALTWDWWGGMQF